MIVPSCGKHSIIVIKNFAFLTALHESICSGDSELIQLIMHRRNHQRFCDRAQGIPLLLTKIRDVS